MTTDREKLLAVWRFFVDNVHDSRASHVSYHGDPVVQVNSYGFAGCYDYARQMYRIYEHMGYKKLHLRNIGGTAHWVPGV